MFCTSGKEMGALKGNGMHDSARELTEMASTQFAFYGLMNPYTYQRPKITPLPNETGLTVPGGTGVAVVPNGTPPALKQPYLPGQYTEYPAAVQGWAQQALPGWGSGIESGTGTKDIYRAVSPEEFDDIFATGGFRARPDGRSFQAKEFGNSFDETLEFANKPINLDKAAIVKVTIPENVYNQLHHMNLDRAIFKSGTPVVEPEMLDMFNESIISIEHAF